MLYWRCKSSRDLDRCDQEFLFDDLFELCQTERHPSQQQIGDGRYDISNLKFQIRSTMHRCGCYDGSSVLWELPASRMVYSSIRPSRNRVPRAFTILEVIIGLILMSTVLVASMLSYSAHQKQLAVADKRIAAVSFADDVLGQLTGGAKKLPRSMRGAIPAQPNWYWQTSVVGTTSPMEVPMAVIRLQVVEVKPDGSSLVLTSVDIVEPIE